MIGSSIGKYKITSLIGEGGMATVYEAEHEILGSKAAVKVLHPFLSANPQIKERFKNEARLMASLNHPNITKVFDFDDQEDRLAILMEFMEGEDLNRKIKSGKKPTETEIRSIFTQTLSAFQYAHEKGIVHRDIKPSNIFILPDGQVKILDFGIAKIFGQGNEMTQTGTQMGTPVYMSPEQVRAEKSIDHRSDIYSLGATLFFTLNGNPPYDSQTDSQFDIFQKIVYQPLPALSEPSHFSEMIDRACRKNKEERFQTCAEWLNAFLSDNATHKPVPKADDQTIIETKRPEIETNKIPTSRSSAKPALRKISYFRISIIALIMILVSIFLFKDFVYKKNYPSNAMDTAYSITDSTSNSYYSSPGDTTVAPYPFDSTKAD
jgi:serine/threonine protein kinase